MNAVAPPCPPSVAFEADGFALVRGLLAEPQCREVAQRVAEMAPGSAGLRGLLRTGWCRELAGQLRRHPRLQDVLAPDLVATQCTYFEKSMQRNWLVPVHQDLSIAVAARVQADSLQGWAVKDGVLHVQPPPEVLEPLVAVRLHLDDCSEEDGPLSVVPGSHRLGRIGEAEAVRVRERSPSIICTARRGDALVMRPLLLHASSKSTGESRRRVLHFVYGPRELPFGLQWNDAV